MEKGPEDSVYITYTLFGLHKCATHTSIQPAVLENVSAMMLAIRLAR